MTDPTPANLTELFTFRLNRLASTHSRLAALINDRQYGLGMRDWRMLAMLGAFSPLSLSQLARETNIDKSLASRSASALIERGLVTRSADEADGRGVRLGLTAEGKALYRKVFRKAIARNELALSVLTPAERRTISVALGKLTNHAFALLSAEKARHMQTPVGGRNNSAMPTRSAAKPTTTMAAVSGIGAEGA